MTSRAEDKRLFHFDKRSKRLALVLAALGLAVVAVSELHSVSSCERHLHAGDFGAAFSTDFDIDRIDCRLAGRKSGPVLQFWGVWPYVGARWE